MAVQSCQYPCTQHKPRQANSPTQLIVTVMAVVKIAHSSATTTCAINTRTTTPSHDCSVSLCGNRWQPKRYTVKTTTTATVNPECLTPYSGNRLDGLVVKASASRAEDPGFESHLRWDFSGSSHTSDLKIVTPVATLPGAWRNMVSAGTGQPGVSIL